MEKLKIYTSYVTPLNLKAITDANMLPVFLIRNIHKFETIWMYSSTSIHLQSYSPSNNLFWDFRDGRIGRDEFEKKYLIELSEKDINALVRHFRVLAEVSGASGIVIMGIGQDRTRCQRSILADLLNESGLLERKIVELIV